MGRIVVMNHVTLDGVIQGPGGPMEDTRAYSRRAVGEAVHDGWRRASKAMGERMAAGGGLKGWLFGRRTYEGLLEMLERHRRPVQGRAQQRTQVRRVAHSHGSAAVAESTLLHGDALSP